jgi:hypothetical protein
VPTNFIAHQVKDFLIPDAVLVGKDSRQNILTREKWHQWDETNCGIVPQDTSLREWIFIGTGEPMHASHDCYPMGSYDRFRKEVVGQSVDVSERNLIVFASRDNGSGSGLRMPRAKDSAEIENWLSGELASQLGLLYIKLFFNADPPQMRRVFERARIIFAPHGGALSNLVYCHKSTIVVEFQPSNGMRLCYACMAYALRFPMYAVFIPPGPFGWSDMSRNNLVGNYTLSVDALRAFWNHAVLKHYGLDTKEKRPEAAFHAYSRSAKMAPLVGFNGAFRNYFVQTL